ncbi:MAG: hypothetical protein KC464_25995, partial [Myxococcales bacterium]|nr:hypothetical protein [Myxococcales bacterium]
PSAPASSADATRDLADARDALAAGDYDRVVALVTPIDGPTPADRAEARRLLGLARFFLGDYPAAEAAFLDYLALDLDGRLDPALVPPEAVTFFEDVRSRHAAELAARRPRQRRYWILNLVPVAGQIQNGERGKALALGGVELGLAATNLTTFLVLRSWCSREGFTCESSHGDVPDTARKLRTVNYLSGAALVGVYLYGVWDGVRGYRRHRRERALPIVTAVPMKGGVVVGATLSF